MAENEEKQDRFVLRKLYPSYTHNRHKAHWHSSAIVFVSSCIYLLWALFLLCDFQKMWLFSSYFFAVFIRLSPGFSCLRLSAEHAVGLISLFAEHSCMLQLEAERRDWPLQWLWLKTKTNYEMKVNENSLWVSRLKWALLQHTAYFHYHSVLKRDLTSGHLCMFIHIWISDSGFLHFHACRTGKKRKSVFRVQVIFYFSKYNIFLRIMLNVYHDCSPTYSTIIYMYPSGCATIRFLCIQFKWTMLCSEMQSVCRGFSITCLPSLGQWHQPPTLAFCVVHTQWLSDTTYIKIASC